MSAVECSDCHKVFEGSRDDARRARWEPNSGSSQWALDQGPMTCPDCIMALLDSILDAMKRLPAEAWLDDRPIFEI